jgi:hypothetical protein
MRDDWSTVRRQAILESSQIARDKDAGLKLFDDR